jgi:hypothetical protein
MQVSDVASKRVHRHCEEQRDEAIQTVSAVKVWIASLSLAMTEPKAYASM